MFEQTRTTLLHLFNSLFPG